MSMFGNKAASDPGEAPAPNSEARSDSRSEVWDELMAQHGHSDDACRHPSRHDKWEYTESLIAGTVETLAVATILDTALNVPGSGLNLYGTELPMGGEEASGAAAGLASGLLGSIFSG